MHVADQLICLFRVLEIGKQGADVIILNYLRTELMHLSQLGLILASLHYFFNFLCSILAICKRVRVNLNVDSFHGHRGHSSDSILRNKRRLIPPVIHFVTIILLLLHFLTL